MEKTPNNYDTVAYPSTTHPQTHPDRAAVVGRLLGMACAPVHQCRVLELGCGDGGNLLPMAWGLPGGHFTGIDLAEQPIARARQAANELGLSNLQLVHGDIAEIGEDWGQFDYIIAHGVFSWVPAPVRDHLLSICRKCLAPEGIAFVSYNTFPGWHLGNMLREMMLFHVRAATSPQERVNQAKAFCVFLANADDKHAALKAEAARTADYEDGIVFHDDLAAINQPFYFTQFISMAASHGLQFLGEAHFSEMFEHTANPEVRQVMVSQMGANRILREQYHDFLHVRRFRQTLLCHREQPLPASFDPLAISGLWISTATTLTGADPDLTPGVSCVFQKGPAGRMETDYAAGKAAMAVLIEASPAARAFPDLLQAVTDRLSAAGLNPEEAGNTPERLCEFLLSLYSADLIELRTRPLPFVPIVTERPIASALARWQAQRGDTVTTAAYASLRIEDDIVRYLITLLDGSRDPQALATALHRRHFATDANPNSVGSDDPSTLMPEMEKSLKKLARMGLLVG